MINVNKTSKNRNLLQVAGVLPGDHSVEFVGVRNTKKVVWIQNGCTHYFTDLPVQYFNLLKTAYLKDHKAQRFLTEVTESMSRQVELYTYYMYGDLDGTPDIKNGILAPSENFRDKQNCPSLLWNSKNINIGQHILTPRQIVILDLWNKELPDKAVAASLNISPKTLDNHKQVLFKRLNVHSKFAVLKLAYKFKVIA